MTFQHESEQKVASCKTKTKTSSNAVRVRVGLSLFMTLSEMWNSLLVAGNALWLWNVKVRHSDSILQTECHQFSFGCHVRLCCASENALKTKNQICKVAKQNPKTVLRNLPVSSTDTPSWPQRFKNMLNKNIHIISVAAAADSSGK